MKREATTVGAILATLITSEAGTLDVAPLAWDMTITSMDLSATATLPLGTGYTPMLTDVQISLGRTPTLGKTFVNGPVDGPYYNVESFFDVFFNITITDVDSGSNFPGMADGQSLSFLNNGPAGVATAYWQQAEPNLPAMGLLPPPDESPYIGSFKLKIPLGMDVGGNQVQDRIEFTGATLTVLGGAGQSYILPDGTSVMSFDTRLLLKGDVTDDVGDPPFSITLTGPTTGTAKLVPEPEACALTGSLGMLAFAIWRRVKR